MGRMDYLERYFHGEQMCDPRGLVLKHAKMAASAFGFFRGSAGMFYELWGHQRLFACPDGWLCGDAHWENVGSYKGKNHVAYFDFTDFDCGALGPIHFDLGRALTGLYLTPHRELGPHFLAAYREELMGGKPFHIETEVAKGTIERLLDGVASRSQRKFIARWVKGGRIVIREGLTHRLAAGQRRDAARVFRRWAKTMKNSPFFTLIDICGSDAGLGILGHRRYLVLVRGNKAPHLIDMKEGCPSPAAVANSGKQPDWSCEGERIAEIQRMIQYMPIARLGWARDREGSFVLTEFQPSEDRVDSLALSSKEYRDFACQWGKLLAWAHLRGGGWAGAATTSELIEFGRRFSASRRAALLSAAGRVAKRYEALFAEFKRLVASPAQ